VDLVQDNLLQEFEEYLDQNIPDTVSFHPYYNDALKKMFSAGGKRFRPLILLNVVKIYAPALVKNAYAPALAIEMLHTYSLIHDDLPTFDNSPIRRGVETLHVTYDEVTATLIGDALNTHSFNILANSPLSSDTKIELIKALSSAGGISGMVLGQALDCHFENKKLSLEELTFLHINKTAKLIATTLKMGGIISGISQKKLKILEDIGLKIGLLFQVHDDIIDQTLTQSEAGKPTGNDKDKNTFTNLLGLDGANQKKEELKEEIDTLLLGIDSNLQERLKCMIRKYL
jgi:farnesyl diphosphate synthase